MYRFWVMVYREWIVGYWSGENRGIGIMLICVLSINNLLAQVANDAIENIKSLEIGKVTSSSTSNCTVQWHCVDQSLTGKCIEYHNDQWFLFNSLSYTKLYINLFNQDCRDLKGVQMVVIDGTPCKTETYKILTCISLETQDDINVFLENLEENKDYIINIDGYLEDQCRFEIEVSGSPKGISQNKAFSILEEGKLIDNVVQIKWELPDSLKEDFQQFKILKRSGMNRKYKNVAEFYLDFSHAQRLYSFSYKDTLLNTDNYSYQIVGINNEGHEFLLKNYSFRVDPLNNNLKKEYQIVEIPLDYKNNTSLQIRIWDSLSNQLIEKYQMVYNKKQGSVFKYSTHSVEQKGIKFFKIEIVNETDKSKKVMDFELD